MSVHSEPIQFSETCCLSERNIFLDKLRIKDFEKENLLPGSQKILMSIGVSDLNDDGMNDFLVQVKSPLHCGSSGCEIHIFITKSQGDYSEVRGPSNAYPVVKISKNVSLGMHDLIFQRKKGGECIWGWNGEQYNLSLCD